MSEQVIFGDFNEEEMIKATKTLHQHITFRFNNSELTDEKKVLNGDEGLSLLKNVDVSKVALESKLSAKATPFKPGSTVMSSLTQSVTPVKESLLETNRATTAHASSSQETTTEPRVTQEVAVKDVLPVKCEDPVDVNTSLPVNIDLKSITFMSDSSVQSCEEVSTVSPSRKMGKIDFLYEDRNRVCQQKQLSQTPPQGDSPTGSQPVVSSPISPPPATSHTDTGPHSQPNSTTVGVNTMTASSLPPSESALLVASSPSSLTLNTVLASQSTTVPPPSSSIDTVSTSSLSVNTVSVLSPSVNTVSAVSPMCTTSTVWNQPKDWGSVFKSAATASQLSSQKEKDPGSVSPDSCSGEAGQKHHAGVNPSLLELGDKLRSMEVIYETTVELVPRGLLNTANLCYLHCILQMFLACPPFVTLLRSFNPDPPLSAGHSPTLALDAMVRFVHEFDTKQGGRKKKKNRSSEFPKGQPIKSDYIHSVFEKKSTMNRIKGRQEDAEEFLGVILDSLHEEMVSAMSVSTNNSHTSKASQETSESSPVPSGEDESLDGEEWEQVGFNNKSMITRQASFSESPISEIFRGEMLSIIQKQGSKESATKEPFFALPLDIQGEGVTSVEQALEKHGAKETLSDVKCSKTNTEVEASKKISLSRLPPIFILHLKRFSYDDKGSQKLLKPIDYQMDLEISRELLAPCLKKCPVEQRKYHLTAVVYHHGINSTGGHYTCDVFLPHCGGWINANDNTLNGMTEEKVLKGQNKDQHKVAYLLCYSRSDLMPRQPV